VEVVEIAELYKHVKKHFPFFDASIDKVKEDYKYLKDFPKETAWENVDQHILTETVTPTIAHIRGRLGEQIERERMRTATDQYFAEREEAKKHACSPPPGWKEGIYAKLGKHATRATE
jgi:hypothetical protein